MKIKNTAEREKMSNKWIYDKVENLTNKYTTRNPSELIKALGIKLYYIDEPDRLLGAYKVIFRNRVILIANNIGDLKNIVLAHELGHDQLHRQYCINGAMFHENNIFNPTDIYEIEANIFASHLLISDEDLLNVLKETNDDKVMAYKLGVDINLLNLKISEMVKLKKLSPKIRFERPRSDFLGDYSPSG